MTKFTFAFLSLILCLAPMAQAHERHCRAILLMGGFDNPLCQDADEALFAQSSDFWNKNVCKTEVQGFDVDGYQFARDNSSGNLLAEGCEWEVRANSEGAF